jgi:tetratricopeptide (TPR) repeat protein
METYKQQISAVILLLLYLAVATGCQKQDEFLSVKNRKSSVTPATIQDFQAILDNTTVMNQGTSLQGLVGSDNIYLTDANYAAVDQVTKNAYVWASNIYQGNPTTDWNVPYQAIEWSNIVLDGLEGLSAEDKGTPSFNNLKGSALFYRAFAYFRLIELFTRQYSSSATIDLGVPLRLNADVTVQSTRPTLKACYDQVTGDLQQAAGMLPETPSTRTRPSSVAANALLAKIYLNMGNYQDAYQLAARCLKSLPVLLDFNTLRAGTTNPFPTFSAGNPEIIFYAQAGATLATVVGTGGRHRMDTLLMKTYQSGDLRKTHFFLADGTTGLFRFKGSYSATSSAFSGIAINELYLIHAECAVRTGNQAEALKDINTLLKNRYTTATFRPVAISDPTQLLTFILEERRKELPFTGNIRWDDLKRLNDESKFSKILYRVVGGQNYNLLPNDNRYVLPIPDQEIQMQGLEQNPR